MSSDAYHGYDDEPLSTEHLGDGDQPTTVQMETRPVGGRAKGGPECSGRFSHPARP